MSSREQVALRCILPGFDGTSAPAWLLRSAERGLGGVVIFARNIDDRDQLRGLIASLHAERSELLVAIDEEGGDVTRLEAKTGSSYPGNLALGAAGDPELTENVAHAIGADLAALGIDLNLAPVADVNSDPRNPVIGVRSFGSDPSQVALHVAAWVRGIQSTGVAACAKHFPGHGDTSVDSHLDVPVGRPELRPFEAAFHAGARAVMSAHVVVPGIDTVPATISRKVMTGLLREQLGFDGLAISDGLDMGGISGRRGLVEAALLAVRAGCDALVVGGGPTGAEVVAEIAKGLAATVDEERLNEAARRVDALARWRARPHGRATVAEGAALAAARRALCVSGPVQVRDDAVVIQLGGPPSIAAGEIPWGLTDALETRGVRVSRGDAGDPARSVVIVVRDLHRDPSHRDEVEAMLARRPDAVVVEMGVPAYRPRGASAYIATHGSAPVCAVAAAEVMRP